jgi:predicted HAD superfamily phosphohydrolase YqeG
MRLMGTTASTTAMVGDQLFTDIYGANRLGLLTVLVDPVSPRDSLPTRLFQRPLEQMLGRLPKQP